MGRLNLRLSDDVLAAANARARLELTEFIDVMKLYAKRYAAGIGRPKAAKTASPEIQKESSKEKDLLFNTNNLNPGTTTHGKPKKKTEVLDKLAQEVHRYYCEKMDKNPLMYELTAKRRAKLFLRFQELGDKVRKARPDLSAQERVDKVLVLATTAIDNLAASDFHMGRAANSNGTRYNDLIANCFKTLEEVEKWLQ